MSREHCFWACDSARMIGFYWSCRTRGLGSQRCIERMWLQLCRSQQGFSRASARYLHRCNQLLAWVLMSHIFLRKMPGTLLRWMTSRSDSPEKPATRLGMPSGGTTLIHTLQTHIPQSLNWHLHLLCDLYAALNFLVMSNMTEVALSYR